MPDRVLQLSGFRIFGLRTAREVRVLREVRTCRLWRRPKVAIIRKGEETQDPLVCRERQLGSRQPGMWGPKASSPPQGPHHAQARVPAYAHGHLHIPMLDLDKASEMRYPLPTFRANSHTCPRVYRSNRAAELARFPAPNERAPPPRRSSLYLSSAFIFRYTLKGISRRRRGPMADGEL